MSANLESTSPEVSSTAGSASASASRPNRPCDTCRRRKSKCVFNQNSVACVLCEFHKQVCTFDEQPAPRPKRKATDLEAPQDPRKRSLSERLGNHESLASRGTAVHDYADLQGASLLKTTLGLQNHRHALFVGASGQHDSRILALRPYDQVRAENNTEGDSFRRVATSTYFCQFQDSQSPNYASDIKALDTIEAIVSPHGEALIKLYFRIVHPAFPILHKKVYLEKYARSHREFTPPLLAAVYLLALDYWDYSAELSGEEKPDAEQLESIAFQTLQLSAGRAKLSTVQAGLLLLQNPIRSVGWQLTSQLVAIGQDLGLHQDCSNWQIPRWERGLRKRLAWALYLQSCWSSLVYGRPLSFPPGSDDWAVQPVTSEDFPESAADEDEEDGSTEVEKGRTLFSAMIGLTRTLADILCNLYSTRAELEIAATAEKTKFVLSKAKGLQLKLRGWYTGVPDSLKMSSNSKVGKLSSIGWLHTSYFAAEMTLHRAVLNSITPHTDPYLAQVCRSAAKERLVGAIDLISQLRPEHLHSFWYFASSFNFALIGIFAALCMATSSDQDEIEYYLQQLQAYRWRLRVSSKNVDFLRIAGQMLEKSVGSMLKRTERKGSDGTMEAFLTALSPVENTPPEVTAWDHSTFDYYDQQLHDPFRAESSLLI